MTQQWLTVDEGWGRRAVDYATLLEPAAAVGEEEFHRHCVEVASDRVRAGLPLRAEINCVGLTARVAPVPVPERMLLGAADTTSAGTALAEQDLADLGFVMNATELWMHDPDGHDELFALIGSSAKGAGHSVAEPGVAAIVGTGLVGDACCPLAWGDKLAGRTTPEVAASVVGGSDDLLDERSRAIAGWARRVAGSPRSITAGDLEELRQVGFDNTQALRLTLLIALRLALATVNGALGARPEQEYVDRVDPAVRAAWEQAGGRIG